MNAADLFAVVVEQLRLIQVEMRTGPLETAHAGASRREQALGRGARAAVEGIAYPILDRSGTHLRQRAEQALRAAKIRKEDFNMYSINSDRPLDPTTVAILGSSYFACEIWR
ncbi:hypothetical protein AB4156_35160 [Cupriavidus sp. 2MCAB6]|uniref:hypothetical protein n=1 Tax=Cupriavidus sp. 2MCAB6 TaxID=3232981 RepID=UPI003F905D18